MRFPLAVSRPLFSAAAALAVVSLSLTACSSSDEGPGELPLTVYATTGYLADAVANIAPDAEVTTMVGPGGDPHTYQPSTRDIQTIQSADVVFWNALFLEAQMIDQLESLGERQLAVGEQLPEELLLDADELATLDAISASGEVPMPELGHAFADEVSLQCAP